MAISVKCAYCKKSHNILDKFKGKYVRCSCGTVVKIKGSSSAGPGNGSQAPGAYDDSWMR